MSISIGLGGLIAVLVIFLFVLYFVVAAAAQKGIDESDTKKTLEKILKKQEGNE